MLTTKPDGRKAYIPAGCDQQGRLPTGCYLPAGDDFPEPHMALPKRLQPVEPIETEPGDLEEARHSVQSAIGPVLALGALAAVALTSLAAYLGRVLAEVAR